MCLYLPKTNGLATPVFTQHCKGILRICERAQKREAASTGSVSCMAETYIEDNNTQSLTSNTYIFKAVVGANKSNTGIGLVYTSCRFFWAMVSESNPPFFILQFGILCYVTN